MRFPLYSTVTILTAAILLSGCTTTTYLTILAPADLTLPQDVKSIAVINRTLPENKQWNIVEGILTGEGIGMDRDAAHHAFRGITEALGNSPRFEVKETNIEMKGSGGEHFPTPLSWEEVEKICASYNTQAVLALESFDSDFASEHHPVEKMVKGPDGINIPHIDIHASQSFKVTLGWRLYIPADKRVADQFRMGQGRTWEGVGATPLEAFARMPQKRIMLNEVSYLAGKVYGTRITPTRITVQRFMYTRGHEGMERAKRMAVVNDWKGSAQVWQALTKSSDRKLAGRACHNMALANEVMGNLDEARNWAAKGYQEFGNRKAHDYLILLDTRIMQDRRLKRQMGEE